MFWKNDCFYEKIGFIALISFAATPTRLTNGSRETVIKACEVAVRYPDALIFGGTYFKNPEPNFELLEKRRVFGDQFVWVGPVSSTTDEREAIVREATKRGLQISKVIVVDESYHAIRTKIVWRHYHPNADIRFRLVPGSKAADWKNPMLLQRIALVWLVANLALAPLYKWFPGVKWFAKRNFSQPAF